jgi:uncharacterized protein (TIGR02996 family)
VSTWFVYRLVYDSLLERHVRRFEDDTVLAWAQRIWRPIGEPDEAHEFARTLLGGLEVPGFYQLFHEIWDQSLSPPLLPPASMEEVAATFYSVYSDEFTEHGPHHLQFLAHEARARVAVYLFDDDYKAAHPAWTEFLVQEGWALPPGDANSAPDLDGIESFPCLPAGDGEGTLYPVCLDAEHWGETRFTSRVDRVARVDGLRVADLCRYLLMRPPEAVPIHGLENVRRALSQLVLHPTGDDAGFLAAICDDPADRATWNAYTDWLIDRDQPPAGLHLLERALRLARPTTGRAIHPEQDRVAVHEHLVQARKYDEDWAGPQIEEWIYFDDRWIAAHPLLAVHLFRFAARWDVL